MLYTARNKQFVAILLRQGLNSVLLPTLLTVVHNIVSQLSITMFQIVDNYEQREPKSKTLFNLLI